MFADLRRSYDWVPEAYSYEDLEQLIAVFDEQVVEPAEAEAKELRSRLQ
jgi:hypothetical protein